MTPERASKRAQLNVATLGTTRLGASLQSSVGPAPRAKRVDPPTTAYTEVPAE